jgi:DNA sulfur modification protein DndB
MALVDLGASRTMYEFKTFDEARVAAVDAASGGGGAVFPCQVFTQGQRLMVTLTLPFATLGKHVEFRPASKGGDTRHTLNRPLMPEHVAGIFNYLRENKERYILPPVTLNADRMPELFTVQAGRSAVRGGYLVITDGTQFAVTDGQHRIAAIVGHNYAQGGKRIDGVLDVDSSFREHGLPVLLTIEPQLEQVHQDFADAAQTRPIPASLLAAYNTREPVNRVLSQVIDKSPLLRDRVDETSASVSKLSQHLFVLSQVRSFLKTFMLGDYALADDVFVKQSSVRLATLELQDEVVTNVLQLFSVLTEKMAPWSDIVGLKMGAAESNVVPSYRAEYLNMSQAGLSVIGYIGYYATTNERDDEYRQTIYEALATDIDWKRSASMWRECGLIIPDPQKPDKLDIGRGRTSMLSAANAVRAKLGI